MSGKVTLVGAGPGDPGLLTVKGLRALEQAEVVVYDRLVSPAVLELIPSAARRIDVGKQASRHPVPQHRINRILLEEALAGNNVVRLKGGDPFVFGRGGEELETLARGGAAFEEIPGVTSAIAAAAYGGIPVTHRDYASSLHIVTGHAREGLPGTHRRNPAVPYGCNCPARHCGGPAGGRNGPGYAGRHGRARNAPRPAPVQRHSGHPAKQGGRNGDP